MTKRVLFLSFLTFFLLSLSPASAQITVNLVDPNYARLNDLRPSGYVTTAINLLFGGSGVAAFIYLLWGGFQWVTSGGDKEALDKARRKITTALIGLAIVFSAYVLLYIIQVLFNISLVSITFQPIQP